jgi:hypothetical protein
LINPPKIDGVDDVTGDALIKRYGDASEIILIRDDLWNIFFVQVVEYYSD